MKQSDLGQTIVTFANLGVFGGLVLLMIARDQSNALLQIEVLRP